MEKYDQEALNAEVDKILDEFYKITRQVSLQPRRAHHQCLKNFADYCYKLGYNTGREDGYNEGAEDQYFSDNPEEL